jgi:iron complex transport system ATP-binding protein
MIVARELGFAYPERSVFSGVSLELRPGELLALIGPNGAGKTTLIHVLSGVRQATTGEVLITDGAGRTALSRLDPEARARRLAVVEQAVSPAFDFLVKELVALGRYPHRHSSGDHEAVIEGFDGGGGCDRAGDSALRGAVGGRTAARPFGTGAGAAARVLLLDEPLAHLDPKHQVGLLLLLRRLATAGLSVLWSVHDLNLARHADRVALLAQGKLLACGPPSEVLTARLLEAAYETPLHLVPTEDGSPPLIVLGSPRRCYGVPCRMIASPLTRTPTT